MTLHQNHYQLFILHYSLIYLFKNRRDTHAAPDAER
jgi:hypothetical protein